MFILWEKYKEKARIGSEVYLNKEGPQELYICIKGFALLAAELETLLPIITARNPPVYMQTRRENFQSPL